MLAAGAAGLLRLELGDCAEASADGHADGASVTPAVSCEEFSVSTASDLATEAEVAIVPKETSVGLAADQFGAAAGVGGGEAPGAAVEGTELVAGQRGRAGGWLRLRRARWDTVRAGNIGAAADGHLLAVRPALSRADTASICFRVLALIAAVPTTAPGAAVVVAADSHEVSIRAFVSRPNPLVVVLAAGAAGLLGLELGDSAEAGARLGIP